MGIWDSYGEERHRGKPEPWDTALRRQEKTKNVLQALRAAAARGDLTGYSNEQLAGLYRKTKHGRRGWDAFDGPGIQLYGEEGWRQRKERG